MATRSGTDPVLYEGVNERGSYQVYRVVGGHREDLDPRYDLANHSPTGFSWGYEGSGPAQLALAILADYMKDSPKALLIYQDFKRAVVARLPGERWSLRGSEVEAGVRRATRGAVGAQRGRDN